MMSVTLKPYSKYKDSGVPWLGDIPAHWDLVKTKYLFRERRQKGCPDEPLLAATQTKGVVRKELYESRTVLALKDLHLLKLVRIGDFVISLRSFQGGIEYAHYQGIISPAYTILTPSKQSYPIFFKFLFKSKPYISNISLFVTGIRQGQNIDYERLSRSLLPVPHVEEQEAIARYLAHTTSRINQLVLAKRRMIELLNEQKQAIIHRAVTLGLDPNVRLKPSGIDWLGDVPEHWQTRRLKSLVRNVNNQTSSKAPNEVYIAMEQIESWTGKLKLPKSEVEFESQVKRFQQGDILFGKLRPYLAKVTRLQQMGVCVGELLVLRNTGKQLLSAFLEQKLRSKQLIDLINSSTFGAKMPRADWTFIGNVPITYPPTHDEQQNILKTISTETDSVAAGIQRSQCEIELLQEYRTRLIADVVTGKLDVRTAAANLPNEPVGLDEADALAEDEEMIDGDLDAVPEEAEA